MKVVMQTPVLIQLYHIAHEQVDVNVYRKY